MYSVDSFKIKSKTEFCISSGIFFQSWLALCAILCSRIFRFKYVETFDVIGIFSNFRDQIVFIISEYGPFDSPRRFQVQKCIFAV